MISLEKQVLEIFNLRKMKLNTKTCWLNIWENSAHVIVHQRLQLWTLCLVSLDLVGKCFSFVNTYFYSILLTYYLKNFNLIFRYLCNTHSLRYTFYTFLLIFSSHWKTPKQKHHVLRSNGLCLDGPSLPCCDYILWNEHCLTSTHRTNHGRRPKYSNYA